VSEAHATEPLVLVVEDDPALASTLRQVLVASGYAVSVAESGSEARAMLEQVEPQLILLDLVLPDTDGLILATRLKSLRTTPIIIMSARAQQADRVLGLKLGADDFITKPFDVDELLARIVAVLRRATPPRTAPLAGSERMTVGELAIVRSRALVTLGSQVVQLTPTEYRLLVALATHVDEVLPRAAMLKLVWGYDDPAAGHVVDVHLGRLRKKLRRGSPAAPQILTVRGRGFMLASTPARA
jgi:two-component system response regulator MprA